MAKSLREASYLPAGKTSFVLDGKHVQRRAPHVYITFTTDEEVEESDEEDKSATALDSLEYDPVQIERKHFYMSDDDEDSKAAERGTYYDRTGGRGPANIGWHNDLAKSRKETNELGIRKAEYKNAIGAAIEYGDFVTMENKKLEKLLVIGRQRIADLKNIKHGLERDVNKYIQKHFKQYDDAIFDLEAKLEEMKAENAELKKKSAAVE